LGPDTRSAQEQAQYAKWEKSSWFQWGMTKLYRTSDLTRNLIKGQVRNQLDPENNISIETIKTMALGTEILSIIKDLPDFSVYKQLNNFVIREIHEIGTLENSLGVKSNDAMAFKMMMSGKATAIIEDHLFRTLVDEHQYGFLNGMTLQGNKSVKTLMKLLHNKGIDYTSDINPDIINKIIDDNNEMIYGTFLDKLYQHATLAVASDKNNIYDNRNKLGRLYDEFNAEGWSGIRSIGATAISAWLTAQTSTAIESAKLIASNGKWVRDIGKGGRLIRHAMDISTFLKLAPMVIDGTKKTGDFFSKFGWKNTKNVAKSYYKNGLFGPKKNNRNLSKNPLSAIYAELGQNGNYPFGNIKRPKRSSLPSLDAWRDSMLK
jgi:hypothetical protein